MKLLVGLGNPGPKYALTRHNIGFIILDALYKKYGSGKLTKKFKGELGEITIGEKKIPTLKPLTYMNDSGESVQEIANFYKISPEEICVIHDDLDLMIGKVRVKKDGGNGGHNGLKSLDQHIGTSYVRIRIGIGHPGDSGLVHDHVLKPFTKDEWQVIDQIVIASVEHFNFMAKNKPDIFMSRIAEFLRENNGI